MKLFPLEDKMSTLADEPDHFVHNNAILYNSRLFGIMVRGCQIAILPFYELSLIVEHVALAILNEINEKIQKEKSFVRELHLRNVVQHTFGATLMPVAFGIQLLAHSLRMLHPFLYHWSDPNKYLFSNFLLDTFHCQSSFSKFFFVSPEFNEERVKNLIRESMLLLHPETKRVFRNGCVLEQGRDDKGEPINKFMMVDFQSQRIWKIEESESVYKVTEQIKVENPFIRVESSPNGFSFEMVL